MVRIPSAALLATTFVSPLLGQTSTVALFDGKTLNGWRGDPAVWSVRDGSIVGSTVGHAITHNTFLVFEGRQPADFVFAVTFRLEGDNNSGVQYRSRELDGGGFRLAGPQCDIHATPNYLLMLYDEQGAGIVARQGQCVRWRETGPAALGELGRARGVDLGTWHTLRVHASGSVLWHELDGRLVTAVVDERPAAARQGLLGLQVHAGAEMTVYFKDLVLTELATPEPVPPAVSALLQRDALQRARQRGPVPAWMWDAAPGADEELFFRRCFELPTAAASARLAVACDNHCRIYLDGELVGQGDEWERPIVVDVSKALGAGAHALAVHAWNAGGPAALAVRLSWRDEAGDHELVSDGEWRCSDDDPDGWNTAAYDAASWAPVRVLAAMGQDDAPWSRVLGATALGDERDALAAQVAVPDVTVEGQEALRIFDVPRSLGSWVALASDERRRLYASAQEGGLYRLTPARWVGEMTTVERVPVPLGGAHGLLWWRDALYAVVNGKQSGLWRLTDTNGDDVLDHLELLQAFVGEGEHGPHSVILDGDQEHLLVLCGNQTRLPPLAASRVAPNFAEDRLVPRLEDPNDYWEGYSPPGGWLCRCDADGKQWELIACGFRNPYDLTLLQDGRVVVFDADMEWDMGLPWYRPTRLLEAQSGADYGWRIGSAKWPADYPEAAAPLADIGPGSPTGMLTVGPTLDDVLSLDWTFGTIYRGSTPWLWGAPLPLTDLTATYDGNTTRVYFACGGRGLPSTLRMVALPPGIVCDWGISMLRRGDWLGNEWSAEETRTPAAILATLDGGTAAPSRRAQVAARVALERLPVAQWASVALAVDAERPARSLTGLLALVRQGGPEHRQAIVDALGELPFAALSHLDRIAWLRVHALVLLRLGAADAALRATFAARLTPLFPAGDERQDQDLCELLAAVDAPGLLDRAVPLLAPMRPSPAPAWAQLTQRNRSYGGVIEAMAKSMPPTGQIALANALRLVRSGWTLTQRRTLFEFLVAARQQKGGSSYDGYVRQIVDAVWAQCSPAEQLELGELVGKARAEAPKFVATPPRGPGRHWTIADIDDVVKQDLAGQDLAAGHNLFHAVGCASCHYFAGEGGNHGPDLTSLGNKFGARDVLEAVFAPNQVVSEQYAGQVLTQKDGTALFGHVAKVFRGDAEVYEVMPAEANAELVRVPVADVLAVERSPLSPMPSNLVDGLSRDELRQLLAFLLSRGAGR